MYFGMVNVPSKFYKVNDFDHYYEPEKNPHMTQLEPGGKEIGPEPTSPCGGFVPICGLLGKGTSSSGWASPSNHYPSSPASRA